MTIRWVREDPLALAGEPYLHNSRLTVRQLLELRRAGRSTAEILRDHPELRSAGIDAAFAWAEEHADRFPGLLEPTR